MQIEQPDLYQHPAPFEINPYWQEEMTLGPGPPPRRNRGRTANSDKTAKTDKTDTSRTLTTAGTQSTLDSKGSSSISLGPAQDSSQLLGGQGWNRKRYQRPDEEYLENIEEHGPVTKPKPTYFTARAPPVNDLHPPVVSTLPSNWEDRKWMKAKPPSAAFMEGKKGVTYVKKKSDSASPKQSAERADTPVSQSGTERRRKRRPPPISLSTDSDADSIASDSSRDEPPRPIPVMKRLSRRKKVGDDDLWIETDDERLELEKRWSR